jgi:hypothetical protein
MAFLRLKRSIPKTGITQAVRADDASKSHLKNMKGYLKISGRMT